jgi:DNA gyrase subunit B
LPDGVYGAKDIQVLEGLEAVRKRPGMYIGSTGPTGLHHLVYEVVDNAVDEAMAGHCTRIDVTLLPTAGARSATTAAASPSTPTPSTPKMSAAEVVLTVLHAGGKFGGDGYKVSGGLHGVGVSVVNALSTGSRSRSTATAPARDGLRRRRQLAATAHPSAKPPRPHRHHRALLARPGRSSRHRLPGPDLLERFQMMAFLNKGLEIRFARPARPRPTPRLRVRYDGGIIDFVATSTPPRRRCSSKVGYFEQRAEDDHEVEIAFQWNTGYNTDGIHSFANGINTIEGGMHEEGFKKALTNVVNRYARPRAILKEKDENLQGEDIREGLTAIISVRLRDPSSRARPRASSATCRCARWSSGPPTRSSPTGSRRTPPRPRRRQKAIQAAGPHRRPQGPRRHPPQVGARRRRHARQAQGLLVEGPRESELFIVEGDSAGGSAKDARDPRTMAILPIRGKILNVERARIDKMLKNTEIQALISAIGAGFGEEFDVDKIRYHKVDPLCDADVDGSHIRTLLLTFFFRQMRELVERRPRLHRPAAAVLHRGGQGEDLPQGRHAKAAFLAENPNHKKDFQRLKGLGEMDADELWATTMDPTAARCCRSRSSRPPSPTRCSRSSWATTSRAASTSSRPTPRTCGSSTSDEPPTPHDPHRPPPTTTATPGRRRSSRETTTRLTPASSPSRSRRRWSSRSSTTPCRSSCRGPCPTPATASSRCTAGSCGACTTSACAPTAAT